ncbi:MAG: CinA family nicotinamide mononucleotide deamidase-related protein [SAR324 cluster bacterium]
MDIEVICTGDEVLTGKIVNSNYSYIAQKLEDYGLAVRRGATVGDDRAELLRAFQEAGRRADHVIVNGGLGPTVDDLSQEVAAQAAGAGLELHPEWLERMEAFFRQRSRTMPDNNRKQALLPAGSELLDNPIGTACGFALTIGKARFYFTPGVPRELFRMLEEQIVPRILKAQGTPGVIVLKRFHSFGLGESHVDQLLAGLEGMVPDGSLKLGFRAHYPQLETKLTVRAADEAEARRKLAPVEAEVRKRLANFILAEDNDTLEGVVLDLLRSSNATLAVVENFTGGQLTARLAPLPGSDQALLRGTVARTGSGLMRALGLAEVSEADAHTAEAAQSLAHAARLQAGATHGLSLLCSLSGTDPALSGLIVVGLDSGQGPAVRTTKLGGHRDWIRLGAVELGLDCLRRHLKGMPLHERNDFERRPG